MAQRPDTVSWMIALLIGMFAGVLTIARLSGVVPEASQTMLSQLAHLNFGDGAVYIYIQAATAAVLLMAANTSYNDFPRVLFLMARDQQAPRSFLHIGGQLTFRNGILLLSAAAAAIYIGFGGNTGTLLPLYAVGVFLAFTLSQTGMIMHWRHHRDQPHWRRSLAFNATGAVLSGIVFVVAGVTKFTSGAWVSIVLIGAIVLICLRIHRYYDMAGQQLALRPGEATTPAAPSAPFAPRADPGTGATPGRQGGGAPDSKAQAAETPPRSTRSPLSRSWPWTGSPSARSRTPPHSASPRSRCTSARSQRRPTGSSVTGTHGETTCPLNSSSPRIAPWSRRWSTTSGRCTGSART
jgi:hypothetical protein